MATGTCSGSRTCTGQGTRRSLGEGEFYTPGSVARPLASMAAPSPFEWVVEPSAGAGALILALLGEASERYGRALAETITVIGVEISEAAELCRLNLVLAGADRQAHIFQGDSLSQPIVGRDRSGRRLLLQFDCTLANPPFGTSIAVPEAVGEPLEVPSSLLRRQFALRAGSGEVAAALDAGRADQP